jgi:hypothetical protein
METELPFIVWGSFLLAVVALLLAIGHAMLKRRGWAIFYVVVAAVLALVTAVSSAFVGGGIGVQ